MARTRIIRPGFSQMPAVGRLSREARLLLVLMPTVADDAGRLPLDHQMLAERLYPFDSDVLVLLPGWLEELERQHFIERYAVEDLEYLRLINWRRLQKIDRPTRSRLPAPPSEPLASHEAREESAETSANCGSTGNPREDFFREREAREESAETSADCGSTGNPREDLFRNITRERVLSDLDRLQRKAEAGESHTAAARYTDMMGRHLGLWPNRAAAAAASKKGAAERSEPRTPSPAEVRGLPDQRRGR
jgi:hypothetical protein